MKYSMECVLIIFIQVNLAVSIKCGHSQFVARGDICCRPVFNCPPGHEIKPCLDMYGNETCEACKTNYVQPDLISSFSSSRECFLKQRECTANDLTYSRESRTCFPRRCKCDIANCFIERNCVCIKHVTCPVNTTLDPNSGECMPCPKNTYKLHIGCSSCITDVYSWRMSFTERPENREMSNMSNTFKVKHTPKMRKMRKKGIATKLHSETSSAPNTTSRSSYKDGGPVISNSCIMVILIVVVVALLTALCFVYWIKKEEINKKSSDYKPIVEPLKDNECITIETDMKLTADLKISENVYKCPVHDRINMPGILST